MPVSCQVLSMFVLEWCTITECPLTLAYSKPYTRMLSQPCYISACIHVSCIVLGTLKDNYDVSAGFFVVQFNGFMSLTS